MKRNWYKTTAGALIVTGEFVNSTGSAQEKAKVVVTLMNESGQVLSERTGTAVPQNIPASGRGFFAVDTGYQLDAVVDIAVTVIFDSPTKAALIQRDVSQWATMNQSWSLNAKGGFTNTLDTPMYGPRVAVVVRDPLKKILWAAEYVHPSWVIPEEQATWTLNVTSAPTEAVKNASSLEALLVFRSP